MVNKDKVWEIMYSKGWSVAKLAWNAGIPEDTLKNILYRNVDCKISTVVRLANALEVSVAHLVDDTFDIVARYNEAIQENAKLRQRNEHLEYQSDHQLETLQSLSAELANTNKFHAQLQMRLFKKCRECEELQNRFKREISLDEVFDNLQIIITELKGDSTNE